MSGENVYLLSVLPGLGELGSDPPLTPAELLAHLAGAPKPLAEAQAIFLGEDLRLREALLAGETEEAEPAVLSPAQLRDEQPLPAFLAVETDEHAAGRASLAVDAVWGAYFRHAAAVGRGSRFLTEWVRHEVGLRNALAAARAKALGLDAGRYLVEPGLGLPAEDYDGVLAEWSAAATPLAALRGLDTARWGWIAEHDAWFTFADDELDAYAARLLLLDRWKRITQAQRGAATPAAAR
ncbi:MAG TPA: hypothetical protein VM695_08490 [Phycisphaerae bacterium]|nr:hypothetical protein [Phycisphaerae bacterium]